MSLQKRVETGLFCHRVPAPTYRPGHRVWLSTRDLPLQVDSQKLAPRLIVPFEIDDIVKLIVHSTFNVSQVKPFSESGLVPPSDLLTCMCC